MDLDPNYDPSDFLSMNNRLNNNSNMALQQHSQFLSNDNDENQHGEYNAVVNEDMQMQQMPLIMPRDIPNNDNVGIDEDLAISESDEEIDGMLVKNEVTAPNVEIVNSMSAIHTEPLPETAQGETNFLMEISKEEHQEENDEDDGFWF